MRKIILFTLILGWIIPSISYAQSKSDTAWKISGETAINFSQVSLINWAAGGQSSVSGNAFFNIAANYKKGKHMWTNKAELAYGLQKLGEEGVRKTNDKLFLSTSYGYKAFRNWYYVAMLSFNTQFADGYDYPNDSVLISTFMAPAYLIGALGLEYHPDEHFSAAIMPVSAKLTVVNNDSLSAAGAYGVDPGDKARLEFGATVVVEYLQKIMENVDFDTKLRLFSSYLNNPQNIDVYWESMLNMKINKFLSANITTTLIYDDDIDITDSDGNTGPRTQFKEVFGLGLSYKF